MKSLAWILWVWLLGATVVVTAGAPPSGRKLYKWLDEQGVTHYGDQVPPEFATQEQHVINAHGIETARVDAQRSADQMAAEEQKKAAAADRALRDHNLLSSYASVEEIEQLRDQRLTLLSDQIKVTGQFLETLNGRMDNLRDKSRRFRPYSDDPKAPPMSDQTAEDLVRTSNDIRTQEQNLKEKRAEEAKMRAGFAGDIARYKELKAAH